jgi:hypothetical protein
LGRVVPVRLLLTIFALGPLAAPCAYAATITVNSTNMTLPPQNDGQCTLIEAMESANGNGFWPDCAAGGASNVVELQVGQTYTILGARNLAGTSSAVALPFVSRPLTINGHGSIITRGPSSGSYRVLFVTSGQSLTLNDLTIQDMILPDSADGAIYNDNGMLTINRSTIKGTRAGSGTGGGAITSRACSAAVLSFCVGTHATLSVTDSAIDDNESRSATSAFGAGAGINTYAVGSGAVNTAAILRSRFHANTATNQGAAVSNAAYDEGATSTTTITRSSITANVTTGGTTPAFGGGLTNFVGKVYTGSAANAVATLMITTTTIASNSAANGGAGNGYGGGIFNEVDCGFGVSCGGGAAAHLSLNSVTIAGNASGRDGSGETRGAGIWSNNNDPSGTVDFTVRDSLIAGNLANGTLGNCREISTTLLSMGYNIASDGGCGAPFNVFGDAQINLAPLNFSSFTYYRAPQAGSVAINKTACNVTVDQLGTARPIGASCDVGAIEVNAAGAPAVRPISDFNGDGRSDAGIFRPSVMPDALWYSTPSGGGAPFQIFFGASGDIPVPADYDGDGKADAVIFRPSSGLWYGPRTGAGTIVIQLLLGQNGDIPVPCDYDGDGAIDPAIYRPSTGLWFGIRARDSTVVLNTNLGVVAGDIPAPADFNGDGRCDPAIMRPGVGPGGTNLWYSVPSGGGPAFQIFFGAPGDIPAPGDYDGDGKADAVIFRPSSGLWYGPRTGTGQIVVQLNLGQNGDIPVAADYDGNGATDPAIYRPSTGLFFGISAANSAVVLNTNLGIAAGDIPTPQRPHYQGANPFLTSSIRNDRLNRSENDTSVDTAPRAGVTNARAHETGDVSNAVLAQHGRSLVAASATPGVTTSATPASGAGSSQPFTLTASSVNGAGNIRAVYAIINSTLSNARGCVVAYDPAANTLQLADDAGTGWSSALPVGGAGTIANAQCAVSAAGSSASAAGNTLTLVMPITFEAAFAGPQTIFGLATDGAGSSGWQSLGIWSVPSVRAPSVSLASPLSARGRAHTFTFTASTPDGAANISAMQMIINSRLSAAGGCVVAYDPSANTLLLADDGGTTWSSPLLVGGAGTIANSRCTIHAAGSSISAVGDTISVVMPVTFETGFAGPKTVYGQAFDRRGGSSNWQSLGSFTVLLQ